jgi:hypothetical protein
MHWLLGISERTWWRVAWATLVYALLLDAVVIAKLMEGL